MNHNLRLSASAATTTVLILGSIAAVVASLMLFQSADNAVVAKVLREGKKAEYAAMACGEVALEKLRLSTAYVGNETITISGTLTCSIGTITNASGVYTVPASAVVGDSTKRLIITVGTITTTLNITGWKE
jgi:hypothetical protein